MPCEPTLPAAGWMKPVHSHRWPVVLRLAEIGVHRLCQPLRAVAGPEEHHEHDAVQRPASGPLVDHPPEGCREGGRNQQHQNDLDEVRDSGRILERMRRVDVEEATAVSRKELDRLPRRDGADRDRLSQTGQPMVIETLPERLGHSDRGQDDRGDDGQRGAPRTAASGSGRTRRTRADHRRDEQTHGSMRRRRPCRSSSR